MRCERHEPNGQPVEEYFYDVYSPRRSRTEHSAIADERAKAIRDNIRVKIRDRIFLYALRRALWWLIVALSIATLASVAFYFIYLRDAFLSNAAAGRDSFVASSGAVVLFSFFLGLLFLSMGRAFHLARTDLFAKALADLGASMRARARILAVLTQSALRGVSLAGHVIGGAFLSVFGFAITFPKRFAALAEAQDWPTELVLTLAQNGFDGMLQFLFRAAVVIIAFSMFYLWRLRMKFRRTFIRTTLVAEFEGTISPVNAPNYPLARIIGAMRAAFEHYIQQMALDDAPIAAECAGRSMVAADAVNRLRRDFSHYDRFIWPVIDPAKSETGFWSRVRGSDLDDPHPLARRYEDATAYAPVFTLWLSFIGLGAIICSAIFGWNLNYTLLIGVVLATLAPYLALLAFLNVGVHYRTISLVLGVIVFIYLSIKVFLHNEDLGLFTVWGFMLFGLAIWIGRNVVKFTIEQVLRGMFTDLGDEKAKAKKDWSGAFEQETYTSTAPSTFGQRRWRYTIDPSAAQINIYERPDYFDSLIEQEFEPYKRFASHTDSKHRGSVNTVDHLRHKKEVPAPTGNQVEYGNETDDEADAAPPQKKREKRRARGLNLRYH